MSSGAVNGTLFGSSDVRSSLDWRQLQKEDITIGIILDLLDRKQSLDEQSRAIMDVTRKGAPGVTRRCLIQAACG